MTREEFAAARATLGLSIDDVAAELNVPPHSVAAMETGAIRVPRSIARGLRYRAAARERELVMANSGLPECQTATALLHAAEAEDAERSLPILEKLTTHARDCAECIARAQYLEQHAPPLPEFPMPAWVRAIAWIGRQLDRLPPPLRLPAGDAGEGRRIALFAAAGFSLLAIGIAMFALISGAMSHRSDPLWWREPLGIAVFAPLGYFIGFFLAGWVFDVTRRIRHRFIGYVIRGALAAAAIYGTMGLMMPAFENDSTYGDVPIVAGILTVVGAIGGGVLWVVHRVRGKLPSRVT
jgi:hypothetical protein